jgi:elongation factor Ts
MKITAQDVNKLRKLTGSGMMDCKKALTESNGDFDKAVENLRKKGQKVAANRADRNSSEGVVLAKVNSDSNRGVLISMNCETDFVAKNEEYLKLAYEILDIAVNANSLDELLTSTYKNTTVSEKLIEQTGVIGEKIEIGGFKIIKGDFVGFYIHSGNKIASIVSLSHKTEGSNEVGKNISMQVAAMNPIALNEEGVDSSIIDKEVEIAKDLLRKEGKPEAMLENIAKGKIKRFFKENTLVNQSFIKDNKVTVKEYVKSVNENMEVTGFARLALN